MERWTPWSIAVLAFAARALFLFAGEDRAWPHSLLYEGDAPVWVQWANALERGAPFEYDLPMRAPGVAYVLHWISSAELAGPFVGLKLLWCAISAATCALSYVVARREVSRRAATIAAGLLCFSFGSYATATSLNNEAPYTFVLVAIAGLTLRLREHPASSTAIATGALHGVALLLRAEHALLLIAFVVWSTWRARRASWRERGRALVLVCAAAIAVCLPWSLRSHDAAVRFNATTSDEPDFAGATPPWTPEARAFLEGLPAFARGGNFAFLQHLARQQGAREVTLGDVERYFDEQFGYVPEPLSTWTLVSSKGPLDFALANDPRAQGGFSRAGLLDGHDPDPTFAFGRPSHLKLYNHGYEIGLDRIAADVGAWLALVGRKLAIFDEGVTLGWTGYDLPYGRSALRRPVDLATPREPNVAARVGIAGVMLAGAALALRRRIGALWLISIAYKLAVTALFWGYARQAVSIAPAFFVLAGIALDLGLSRIGLAPRVERSLGGALVIALLACDVVHCTAAEPLHAQATSAEAKLVPAPQWGPSAFVSFDEIALEPGAHQGW